jgi:hypothetical protein
MATVGEPGVSPRGLSSKPCCPASPSLPGVPGTLVPHLPGQEMRAPSPRDDGPLRLPMAGRGGVRFSLSSPDPLPHSSCFGSLFSAKARVRGGSVRSTPGGFPSPGGTPPPDFTPGDQGLSHVPESPLCMPAPLSAPGGVLPTRLVASRTAACRPLEPVGFPSLPLAEYPVDHDSTYFGALARGLPPRAIQLRTPIAGCARGCHS